MHGLRLKIGHGLRIQITESYYNYYILDLYSTLFMRHTFKGALHSIAAERAQVLPLQCDPTRESD